MLNDGAIIIYFYVKKLNWCKTSKKISGGLEPQDFYKNMRGPVLNCYFLRAYGKSLLYEGYL